MRGKSRSGIFLQRAEGWWDSVKDRAEVRPQAAGRRLPGASGRLV